MRILIVKKKEKENVDSLTVCMHERECTCGCGWVMGGYRVVVFDSMF